ncbi:MAG: hypothetical protein ABSF70_07920 [Terracidiphilus sp.]|jgi:hypothetical protein
MLPDVNQPVWKNVVSGEKALRSSKATVNLLVQGSKMSYGRDPSLANVQQLIVKMHSFFTRYESSFPEEVSQLI